MLTYSKNNHSASFIYRHTPNGLFEDKQVTICYDHHLEALITTWQGEIKTSSFMKGIDVLNSLIQELNVRRLITDYRQVAGLPVEAQSYAAWALSNFVQEHYLLTQACVSGSDAFVKFAVHHIDARIRKHQPGVQVNRVFECMRAASTWIKGVPVVSLTSNLSKAAG